MLQRFALLLLLLLLLGTSAMFAASHFGVTLPWQIAVHEAEETASQAASKKHETEAAGPGRSEAHRDILAATAEALGGKLTPPPSGSVALDISRISPDGMSVFAGRAEPDSYVTVLENGKPAGSAKVDSNGEWSIATEHKFASTDPKLSFESTTTAPPEEKPPASAAKPPATSEARTAAGDVMKKFENLVAQAREDARKEREKATQPATGADTSVAAATEPSTKPEPEPAAPPAVTVETDHGSSPAPTSAPPPAAATSEPAPDSGTSVATVTAKTEPNASESVIPVPLMFVYNEATLTPEGRRAAELLLEYLSLKHLRSIELTGHADERGTDEYNFDLSRDRLETVSRLLKDGGYEGDVKLTPKGKAEPYMGIDRTKYRGEALYQFDRRVELHLR